MSKINDIFSECEEWETAPINELLGQSGVQVDQRIKRVIVYGATQMGKTTMIVEKQARPVWSRLFSWCR